MANINPNSIGAKQSQFSNILESTKRNVNSVTNNVGNISQQSIDNLPKHGVSYNQQLINKDKVVKIPNYKFSPNLMSIELLATMGEYEYMMEVLNPLDLFNKYQNDKKHHLSSGEVSDGDGNVNFLSASLISYDTAIYAGVLVGINLKKVFPSNFLFKIDNLKNKDFLVIPPKNELDPIIRNCVDYYKKKYHKTPQPNEQVNKQLLSNSFSIKKDFLIKALMLSLTKFIKIPLLQQASGGFDISGLMGSIATSSQPVQNGVASQQSNVAAAQQSIGTQPSNPVSNVKSRFGASSTPKTASGSFVHNLISKGKGYIDQFTSGNNNNNRII